ncbi:class 1 fructose-bisphosphatase [Roseinatronobacter sp. S2]|uniref:class 1 fructose-bisphosphatase n=1 Tax=Roseinatronobacter sp. S2 TaxID=3035471 RepID=UPI00240ED918|nr:class 1 fructose-bisphosphatase [Roseinatronobacter sp. S2]WFE76508.1 class 1 fructose-bisphosphatase [Roseinatronobacter sp. S2]
MAISRLTLDTDGPVQGASLDAYLSDAAGQNADQQALAALIAGIAAACVPIAGRLGAGLLPGDPSAVVGTNESGDRQKALDMAAHRHLTDAMRSLSVAKLMSEEAPEIIDLDPDGRFDVAMDPIDGSGSIGIGAPLGAFFCVFPRGDSFLRPGRDIIAAFYLSFGHSVDLGFSTGAGVTIATLDPETGRFHIDATALRVPKQTTTIAYNVSNMRHWSPGLRSYVTDLIAGVDGPRGCDFNMRWIAAAVGDLHRVLRRGGLFLYPADARPGYERGYLRLAYEAFPIAFLIEQAGGSATDGTTPILDLCPAHLHDRVPLIFGSGSEVAVLQDYLS